MKNRKLFGILIMLLGICVFLYPVVKQANAKRVQKHLMNGIKEVIEENMVTDRESSEDTLGNIDDLTNSTIEEDYADLSLTTEEQTEEETPNNVRDRLKNQTVLGIIEIEKIDLIYAVVEGTKDENLGVAIGHMKNTDVSAGP